MRSIQTLTICCMVMLSLMVNSLQAALTAEQRKELKEIGSQLGKDCIPGFQKEI